MQRSFVSKHLKVRAQASLNLLDMDSVASEIAPYSNSQTAESENSIFFFLAEILTIDSAI